MMITTPGARAFTQALAGVRRGGTINIFAAHAGTFPINTEQVYQRELTITSTYSSSPEDLRTALDLLTERLVHVERLISHRLTLEQFHEGVTLMRNHVALKVYFQIGETYGKQSL